MDVAQRTDAGRAQLEQPYSGLAKTFHWLVFVLVAMQASIALVLPALLPKSAEDDLSDWHLSVGSTILFVMALRLAWRLTHPAPAPPADLPPSLRLLSRATHWGLYAALIVLPLLGWTAASGYGATVRLFGLIPLPALIAQDKATAETVGGIHHALAVARAGAHRAAHRGGALPSAGQAGRGDPAHAAGLGRQHAPSVFVIEAPPCVAKVTGFQRRPCRQVGVPLTLACLTHSQQNTASRVPAGSAVEDGDGGQQKRPRPVQRGSRIAARFGCGALRAAMVAALANASPPQAGLWRAAGWIPTVEQPSALPLPCVVG